MPYSEFIRSIFCGHNLDTSNNRWRIILFSLITIAITNLILEMISWATGFHSMTENIADLQYSPSIFNLIFVVAIMPLIEESTFRLFLSGKPYHVLLSLSLLFSTFLSWIIIVILQNQVVHHFIWIIGIFMFIFINALLYFRLSFMQKPPFYLSVTMFVKDNVRICFFISSLLFAISHILFLQLLYRSFNFDIGFIIYTLFYTRYYSGLHKIAN